MGGEWDKAVGGRRAGAEERALSTTAGSHWAASSADWAAVQHGYNWGDCTELKRFRADGAAGRTSTPHLHGACAGSVSEALEPWTLLKACRGRTYVTRERRVKPKMSRRR